MYVEVLQTKAEEITHLAPSEEHNLFLLRLVTFWGRGHMGGESILHTHGKDRLKNIKIGLMETEKHRKTRS